MGSNELGLDRVAGAMRCRNAGLVLYAAVVLAVPFVFGRLLGPSRPHATTLDAESQRAEARVLAGLWSQHEAGGTGAPVAFYYFHGDGHGLYRYGRVGYTNTNSFDYAVSGRTLTLVFRKTGERHTIEFTIEHREGQDWLSLTSDPRSETPTRYFRQRGPVDGHFMPLLMDEVNAGAAPAGHMWIDQQKFATGGAGFSFYQFRSAGIDGRGVGWHHRGDFDDWSTESLVYRVIGDRLELEFTLAGKRAHTSFVVTPRKGDEPAVLWLQSDPRDFWHSHRFKDAGPSWGHLPADLDEVAAWADPMR